MEYKVDKKAKSEVEVTVSYSVDEIKARLPKAAAHISEHVEIKGFRSGKAPYEMVVKQVGDMKVYEEAADILVREGYAKVLVESQLEPLMQPKIEIVKLAPDNEFIFKIIVTTIPKVEIGDIKSISVKDVHVHADEKEVEKVVNDLRDISAMEVLEVRPAIMGDKVDISFDVFRDGVPIDGGKGEKYPLILGKGQMIPGFEEAVVGMNAGEEKEFELAFPEKYGNKNLAGKKATFKVKVNGVFKRDMPDLNDAFAVLHGKKTYAELLETVKHNLEDEETAKQNQRLELEIIEKLIEKSKFDQIPDVLVNQELDKMLSELKQNVMQQGLKFEDYLMHIKKDETALRIDLAAQALNRVKAALLTREIFLQNNMVISDEELDAEIKKLKTVYAQNPEMIKSLETNDYKEWLRNVMGNSKVMGFLKNEVQLEKTEHNH